MRFYTPPQGEKVSIRVMPPRDEMWNLPGKHYIPREPEKVRIQFPKNTWVEATWGERHRRMLIEARVGGEGFFWSVPLRVWDRLQEIHRDYPLNTGEWDVLVWRDYSEPAFPIRIQPVPREE